MTLRKKNKLVVPFVKWVGGKRQLLMEIEPLLPKRITSYFEPFVGGGALLFYLQPSKAYINDLNEELINLYKVIKDYPLELIEDLRKHENTASYFYHIRGLDRNHDEYSKLSIIEKASRIIYLNKTCYNGLYRVNNAGEFNSPFGRYKNPNIVNEITIKAVSYYLNNTDVQMRCGDFSNALNEAGRDSFVYFDPPYDPISDSSSFTGYTQGGFNRDDQIRLKEFCDELSRKGVKFLLSNSKTDFIEDLYKDYQIIETRASRQINSDAEKRGVVPEVLIRNYEK